MKNFNQSIKVEVSVDSIAQQLLSTMNPEFKHNELVVETLIGRMLSNDKTGISMLYNSLNGYTQEIDFQIGEDVQITDFNKYSYWNTNEAGERVRSSKDVELVKIKNIDVYAERKLEVEYSIFNSQGTESKQTEWVSHTQCARIMAKLAV